MAPVGRAPRRRRSRGVATIELAFSMILLIPLLFIIVDFGYYFYIGVNAEDAALIGARAAVRQTGAGTCLTTSVPVTNAQTTVATIVAGNCNGGAAYCRMAEPPLGLGTSPPTFVTLRCLTPATVPPAPDPTWEVTVRVDFRPVIGLFTSVLPSGGPGKARYTAKVTSTSAP